VQVHHTLIEPLSRRELCSESTEGLIRVILSFAVPLIAARTTATEQTGQERRTLLCTKETMSVHSQVNLKHMHDECNFYQNFNSDFSNFVFEFVVLKQKFYNFLLKWSACNIEIFLIKK
jgi:hypothetical protein